MLHITLHDKVKNSVKRSKTKVKDIFETRQFSNHESCLLFAITYLCIAILTSHTCAIIVILDLTPYLLRWEKGHWPLDDLWPHICWVTCVTLPKDHYVQVPWKYIKVCGYSDPFCKNLNQRPLTPRWTKGHWPLDDLWHHICWGHMCDSTQGSLCPSPMEIHQCMWIQWPILQITTYILHVHTTYIWVLFYIYFMSHHIVSFWTKFRRDKNKGGKMEMGRARSKNGG